jgi:hypothetical protein
MKKLGALLSIILALITIYWLSPLTAAAATLVTLLAILFVTTILATIGLIMEHNQNEKDDEDEAASDYLGASLDDRILDKLRELGKLIFRKAKSD